VVALFEIRAFRTSSLAWDLARREAATKRSLFECFPYVCPEPVLVKSSFLYINGAKRPFFHLAVIDSKQVPRVTHVASSPPSSGSGTFGLGCGG
jgi:hypothetical protein